MVLSLLPRGEWFSTIGLGGLMIAESRLAERQRPRPVHMTPIVVVGVVAFVFRAVPYVIPGTIFGIHEYDDGVLLKGALSLVFGQLPYRDFVYLHPPGFLLILTPFASLAGWLTDSGAMALARIVATLVGSANAVLVGLLLRRHGLVALVVGGGLYAAWPVLVGTERTVLLEPTLNLCLLIALLCITTRQPGKQWIAGMAMGLALTVKYWAIVDIAVLAVAVALSVGAAGLWRYLVGGTATAAVVSLPFFLKAPGAMWEQTVVTQLQRPATHTSFEARSAVMSPLQNIQGLDSIIPPLVWAVLIAALIGMALAPLVIAVLNREGLRKWDDRLWWAVLVLLHAAILSMTAIFYYHYAAWLLAPLALTTGAAAARMRSRLWRRLVVAGVAVGVVAAGVGEVRRLPAPSSSALVSSWAATHVCVWGFPQDLVFANAASSNIARGCPTDVDPFGAGLVLLLRSPSTDTDDVALNPQWVARAWNQLEQSDGAMLRESDAWFSPSQAAAFSRQFRLDAETGGIGLWTRISPP